MIRLHTLLLLSFMQFTGQPPGDRFVSAPARPSSPAVGLLEAVAGSYKMKALTIQPGIDFGKGLGMVTDILAFSIKSGNPCPGTLVVNFLPQGTIATTNTPACKEGMSMGPANNDQWVLSNNTLTLTDSQGKRTAYAISFQGKLMRLSGKTLLEGVSDKKERQVTIELVRL